MEAKTEVVQVAAVGVGSVAMRAMATRVATVGTTEAEVVMEAKGVARDRDMCTSTQLYTSHQVDSSSGDTYYLGTLHRHCIVALRTRGATDQDTRAGMLCMSVAQSNMNLDSFHQGFRRTVQTAVLVTATAAVALGVWGARLAMVEVG